MAEAKKPAKSVKPKANSKVKKSEKSQTKKVTKPTIVEEVQTDGTIQESTQVEATTTSKAKEVEKKATAKAGKRSEKGIKEAEEKIEKIEKQQHVSEDKAEATEKPKTAQPPTRTRLERRAKGYRKSAEAIDKNKSYSLKDAVALATKTSHVKFDAGVELHIRLGVDPRQADQNLRDTVVLPAGTGKTVRVAVFADADQLAAAKKAGADIAAGDEFLQQLEKGTIDFDILVATPATMPKLGKYARLLGPKGLMPNPKSGTVTTDIAKAVTEAKAGRLEYRVDSTGIVHVAVGKVSFGPEKLLQNAQAVTASIKANKPGSLKGNYVRSVFVTTSMGPSIRVQESEI